MPNALPPNEMITKIIKIIDIMSSNKSIGKKREKNLPEIKQTLEELESSSSDDAPYLKCGFLIEAGLIYSAIDNKIEANNYFTKALNVISNNSSEDIQLLKAEIQGQICEIEEF